MILVLWLATAIAVQLSLNIISRKINYSYGKKMELLALLLNGFVWGMIYYKFIHPLLEKGSDFDWIVLIFAITSSILISIIFIDFKYYEIPNSYNFIIAVFGIIYITQASEVWLNYLLGGIIAFVLFFIIAIFTGGNLGMGDVKLVGGLGLLLGKMLLMQFFMVTFLSGALISLLLLAMKIKKPKDKIAFGPYIAFAFIWILIS